MVKKAVIGMVLYPGTTQLDLTAPHEVFARLPETAVHVLSHSLAPVKTERGLLIVPDMTYGQCPPLDVLFIPGGPGQMQAQDDDQLIGFIKRQSLRPGCMVASVCTGALLLGVAGLLYKKKATTHWTCMDILPYMGAEPVDAPFVVDGNVITGAGVTNGIDLALHIAEGLRGKEAARRIARHIEYPHLSVHPQRGEIEHLSKIMLAENPNRPARLEAAKKTADKLGIKQTG